MEFKSSSSQPQQNVRRGVSQERPNNDYPPQGGATVPSQTPPARKSPLKWIVTVVVLVLLIAALGCAVMWKKQHGSGFSAVKSDKYQAVFLTNGQVYFGKVDKSSKDQVKLTNIYYLQVQESVQPQEKKKDDQTQVSLAKLGEELHGPEDVMYISRDQMLFWENLKDDSKVVQAIKTAK